MKAFRVCPLNEKRQSLRYEPLYYNDPVGKNTHPIAQTMVRTIYLEKLEQFGDDVLGTRLPDDCYDEIVREDCDVYLPDGTLALAFRKKALKSVLDIQPASKQFDDWRWFCKYLLSDQRGAAAGKDIYTNLEIRFSHGQVECIRALKKGKIFSLEEARAVCEADTRPSRNTFYVGKAADDGLYDKGEYEKWDALLRKKSTPFELRQEATAKRLETRMVWFDNWLVNVWDKAEDKVECAKKFYDRYWTAQPRANKVYSTVVGAIDRSGRTPFGRLTAPTMERYEEFASYDYLYQDIDQRVKECLPEQWQILNDRFSKVKDPRYNLFGTCFTSVTCNYNLDVFIHRDGNNAKNAVAAITVFENGDYDGMEFILPELRLGFDIRHGDLLCGDNQNLLHYMRKFDPKSNDSECLMLVLYQRDRIITLDSMECETCRREFLPYIKKNHPEYSNGEKTWEGSFPGMFASPEWEMFKKSRGLKCSNTTYTGSEDVYQGARNGAKKS